MPAKKNFHQPVSTVKYTTLMFALCFAFFGPVAGAQEVVRNEEGRSIIVFPDGSWQYFEAEGPVEVWTGKAEVLNPDDQQMPAKRKRAEEAKQLENQLALELIRARLERVTIGQELAEMMDNGNTFPLQTKILTENRLANVKEREKKLFHFLKT